MKVFVYFNFHKKCFSIKALEGERKNKVIAHASRVVLTDVSFKVSQAGRARVLRERRKNVHAGVVGQWVQDTAPVSNNRRVTYNPYHFDSFVTHDTLTPIYTAESALLVDKKIFVN